MASGNSKSKLASLLERLNPSRQQSSRLKRFADEQQRESAYATVDGGTHQVPIDQVIGSVGRYHDFDGHFRPKGHIPHERFESIKKALRQGKRLPPVKLYRIKDGYYVLDGNHRIAAARALGHDTIPAQIVEFIPAKLTAENLIYREKRTFIEETGLDANIELTEMGQYNYLLQQIEQHRQHLARAEGVDKPPTLQAAAKDWYRSIYRPFVEILRKGKLGQAFPERTVGDLYAYITHHHWERRNERRYGIGIGRLVPDTMEAFRTKMADSDKCEYPDMQRVITVFVLMNVKAKNEEKLIDRLFAYDEIKELYSVHGSADLLLKVVLTRDLLSSDAEVISNFVHNHIRQVPGVVSTETLIPGYSRIK
jgi:hypothetical protein